MKEKVRFVGWDVHAETIAVAIAEPDGEVRSLGTISNRAESIRKLVKRLGPVEQLKGCYEAGPTGYVLYWQLAELGVACEVIAPTLVPMKAGDRVKTDRRDAERLARSYRSGDLTAVWVADEGSESLRDLVRVREAAKQDQLRARHRLAKFCAAHGAAPHGGDQGVDGALHGLGAAGSLYAGGARGHDAGLSARGRSHGRAGEAAGASDHGSREAGYARGARGGQGLAGVARYRGDFGGDDHGGIRQHRSFRYAATADGLQRSGSHRELQRQQNATWKHPQVRRRSSQTYRC